jgi:hypothetical protein
MKTIVCASVLFGIFYTIDLLGYPAKLMQLKCPSNTVEIPMSTLDLNPDADIEVTLASEHNQYSFDDAEFPILMTITNKHHTNNVKRGTSWRFVPPTDSKTFTGHLIYELSRDLQPGESVTAKVVIKQEHRPQGTVNYIREFPDTFFLGMQVRDKYGVYRETPMTYSTFAFNQTMFMNQYLRAVQCPSLKNHDPFKKEVTLVGCTGCKKTVLYCYFKLLFGYGKCDSAVRNDGKHVTTKIKSFTQELGNGYSLKLKDSIGNTFIRDLFSERILLGQVPEDVEIIEVIDQNRILNETRHFDYHFEANPRAFKHMFPTIMAYVLNMEALNDGDKVSQMARLFNVAETYDISPMLIATDYNNSDALHPKVLANWHAANSKYSYHNVEAYHDSNTRSTLSLKEAKPYIEMLVNGMQESCPRLNLKHTPLHNPRSTAFDSGCGYRLLRRTRIFGFIADIFNAIWSVRYQILSMFYYFVNLVA